jgi:hypothetical protein
MVLQTLHSMGPQHGYGIARRIEQISDDVLSLNEGTVYASLMRLLHRRRLPVVAVVAVVKVEVAPSEVDVVDDGAEDVRVRLQQLIAGAPDQLARRVVTLYDLHHAVDLARQHHGIGDGSTGGESRMMKSWSRSPSSVFRMGSTPRAGGIRRRRARRDERDARRLEVERHVGELRLAGEKLESPRRSRRRARDGSSASQVDVDQEDARAGLGEGRGEVQRLTVLPSSPRRS